MVTQITFECIWNPISAVEFSAGTAGRGGPIRAVYNLVFTSAADLFEILLESKRRRAIIQIVMQVIMGFATEEDVIFGIGNGKSDPEIKGGHH